ncbi:MAG TPA: arylamine N-acetyltransferase, partial [Thermoanaerobaculia bacterium]|nr:arylamine N-acetyltransferase [Thermoanaerobaculia bacterium]
MRLDDYLARIGLSQPLPPTLDTLRRLHVAHLRTFPFDNLAIQRHGIIRTDIESIAEKFLGGTTGGYCFEQNTLFAAALRELGFEAALILARVGSPERPLTHLVVRVEIDGKPWLADAGFGGEGPLEPLPLAEGVTVQDGLSYELRRDRNRWTLVMHCEDASQVLYHFGDEPHTPADIEVANYYTSTHPSSSFRQSLTIQRVTPEERLILRSTMITRYRNGVKTETAIEPSQIRAVARELFGIELGEAPLL